MDGLDQDAYSWVSEYLSTRFEPVLIEVADYVEASMDGVVVEVGKPRKSKRFSGWVAARFPEREETDLVHVSLYVACRREIHMADLKDGFQMVCRSQLSRILRDGSRIDDLTLSEGPRLALPSGPQAVFGFGDTAVVRQQLDQWADATVAYIRENKGLMVGTLEAARARIKSQQEEP